MDRCLSRILSPRSRRTASVCNRRTEGAAQPQAGASRPKRAAPLYAPSGMRPTRGHRRLDRPRFAPGEIALALAPPGSAFGRIFSYPETFPSAWTLDEVLGRLALAAPVLAVRTGHFRRRAIASAFICTPRASFLDRLRVARGKRRTGRK